MKDYYRKVGLAAIRIIKSALEEKHDCDIKTIGLALEALNDYDFDKWLERGLKANLKVILDTGERLETELMKKLGID